MCVYMHERMRTDALPSFALSIACAACASSALMPFLPMQFPGPSSARGDSALSRWWLTGGGDSAAGLFHKSPKKETCDEITSKSSDESTID